MRKVYSNQKNKKDSAQNSIRNLPETMRSIRAHVHEDCYASSICVRNRMGPFLLCCVYAVTQHKV